MSEALKRLKRLQNVLLAVKTTEMARVRTARSLAETARSRAASLRESMLDGGQSMIGSDMIAEANWIRAQHNLARRADGEAAEYDEMADARMADLAVAHGRELAFEDVVCREIQNVSRQTIRREEMQVQLVPKPGSQP